MLLEKRGTRSPRDIVKFSVAKAFVENRPIFVVNVDAELLDLWKDVAVDQAEIFPAIQIEVEEARAPAHVFRVLPKARGKGHVVEVGLPTVVIQRLEFIGEV